MQKDDEAENKPKPSLLPKWLQEGVSKAASDSVKTVLLPLFLFIIVSGLGFVFYLNSIYIKITFNFPAYQVGFGFALAILIVYSNQKLIRRIFRRFKWRIAYEFLWRNTNNGQLSGPHCQKCKAYVVELKTSYEEQMHGAYKMMQGGKTEHSYKCSNPTCTSRKFILDIDLQTLRQKVHEEYFSKE